MKNTLYWIGLVIAAAVAGYVRGLDHGTPVYEITEVIWIEPSQRLNLGTAWSLECYAVLPEEES